MEGLVQTEARVDVAREFIGLGDDRFKGCPNEGVAVRLAAGQRPGVAAKKGKMRCEFLAKGHKNWLSNQELRRLWRSLQIVSSVEGPFAWFTIRPPPRYEVPLEQRTGHLVSWLGGQAPQLHLIAKQRPARCMVVALLGHSKPLHHKLSFV
jgi:hypothetical protein